MSARPRKKPRGEPGAPKPKPEITRGALALYRKAFSKNWPIPHTRRAHTLNCLYTLFECNEAGKPIEEARILVAAFKALTAADRINIAREAVELDMAEFAYRQECDRNNVITTDAVEQLEPRAADRMLRALLDDPDDDDDDNNNGFWTPSAPPP